MISLINNTKAQSVIGKLVAIDPNNPQAFIYASFAPTKAIGVITESVPYRSSCKIATMGDTARVLVSGNVSKNDVIRACKSTDRTSLGSCVVAKSGDEPYLKIGDALGSGRGIVSLILDLTYVGSSTSGNYIGDEFETVSKNLRTYPYDLVYGVDGVSTITYDLGGGLSIVKTFNYTLGVLTSIVLSGDTPSGIELTKTLSYTGADLTSVAYS